VDDPVFTDRGDNIGYCFGSLYNVLVFEGYDEAFVEAGGRKDVLTDIIELDLMKFERATDAPIELVKTVLIVVDPHRARAVDRLAREGLTSGYR
jgi:hypothetical protein